ncbi:MAG TPA: hypothetical protein VGQ83_26430 [Polyangia bacterium]
MAPAGPDPLGSDPLEPTRRLLARIEVEEVRRRLHDTLVLWELGYRREAIAQFRVSAEHALTRALASGRVDAAARRRHEQLLAIGQTTKVIEWLHHDAEVLPARIALHLHTLLAWGNYASHHQKKAHRVQPSDLAVLMAVTTDLEEWLAVELDGRRSLFGEGEAAVGGQEAEVAALAAGLRPEVARAFVAAGGATVHGGAHHLRAPALSLELHWSVPLDADPAPRAFLGLQSFGLADAARFYGRDDLTRRLCAAVALRTPTLVWGASGSGKTSLLRAGLVPWALAQGVTTLYLSDYRGEGLAAMVKVLKAWPTKSPLLAVLDQLERALLADCPADVRAVVVDAVVRLGRWPNLALCVALREEYLGRLLREADAGEAAETAWVRDRRRFVPVGALAPAAARDGPAPRGRGGPHVRARRPAALRRLDRPRALGARRARHARGRAAAARPARRDPARGAGAPRRRRARRAPRGARRARGPARGARAGARRVPVRDPAAAGPRSVIPAILHRP